ncbi:Rossmann-like domain-containing protein [Chloroflexota bacterium]
MALKPVLEEVKEKFQALVAEHQMGEEPVKVTIGTLSTKQAIGSPVRQDFPLLEGKEVMIEAQFKGNFGQAFTDKPCDFTGSLKDILTLILGINDNRAIFIATLNAVMAHMGMVTGVRHCRNEEPEECAVQIAQHILTNFGETKVGLIGLQPAILENLVKVFGADNVCCTDLNPKNVGSQKFGAEILNGRTETKRLISWCGLLLATSSTIVNNTFDGIRAEAVSRGKRLIMFGVTGAGVSSLLGMERLCFQAH